MAESREQRNERFRLQTFIARSLGLSEQDRTKSAEGFRHATGVSRKEYAWFMQLHKAVENAPQTSVLSSQSKMRNRIMFVAGKLQEQDKLTDYKLRQLKQAIKQGGSHAKGTPLWKAEKDIGMHGGMFPKNWAETP